MAPRKKQADSPDDRYLPPPGLSRRLAIMFYDSLLVLVTCLAVTGIFIFIRGQIVGFDTIQESKHVAISGLPLQVAVFLTIYGFFGWFWTVNGQTLGMQTWRVRIDSNSGGRINWKQATIRFLVAWPSLLLGGIGYWVMLFDNEKRSWPDRASNSHLVLLPKKKKK